MRTMELNPDRWTKISKHLIWRCCKCGRKHRVRLKMQDNEIFIKEWK